MLPRTARTFLPVLPLLACVCAAPALANPPAGVTVANAPAETSSVTREEAIGAADTARSAMPEPESAKPAAAPETAKPVPAAVAASQPAHPVIAELRQRLADPIVQRAADKEDLAAIAAFYRGHDGAPLWVAEGGLTLRGKALVEEMARADDWGLASKSLAIPSFPVAGASPIQLADVEAKLSLAALKYINHASGGRIDPLKLSRMLDHQPPVKEPGRAFAALASAAEPDAFLRDQHPRHPQFHLLQKALAALNGATRPVEAPAAEAEPVKLATGKTTLKPGASAPEIALLRRRLKVAAEAGKEEVYDEALRAAVVEAQKAHGLKADGIVTNPLRVALNGAAKPAAKPLSLEAERQRLVVNMERWRWMPADMGAFHVWDNIPEYQTRVLRDGKVILQEKIIVGKVATPTPVFSADMKYVIFHPEWGVPDSIKIKEILPYLKSEGGLFGFLGGSDTRILERHKMRVSYNGRIIDASQVNWSTADVRRYSFIQSSGGHNVLGVVKFRFPNKHDVYMHDTPQRDLFNQSVRMFSHGCMRVHNPRKLAEVLLAEDRGMGADEVGRFIAANKLHEITLQKRIPVHVSYFTAVADDNGKVHYHNDIYGHDNRVVAALTGKAIPADFPLIVDPERPGQGQGQVASKPVPKKGKAKGGGDAGDFLAGLFGN